MKKYLIIVSPTWSNPVKSRNCSPSGTGDPIAEFRFRIEEKDRVGLFKFEVTNMAII